MLEVAHRHRQAWARSTAKASQLVSQDGIIDDDVDGNDDDAGSGGSASDGEPEEDPSASGGDGPYGGEWGLPPPAPHGPPNGLVPSPRSSAAEVLVWGCITGPNCIAGADYGRPQAGAKRTEWWDNREGGLPWSLAGWGGRAINVGEAIDLMLHEAARCGWARGADAFDGGPQTPNDELEE